MKASEVGWFDRIPSHWETTKVRFVAELESGHTPSKSNPEYWQNCTIPWVTTADVSKFRGGNKIYLENTKNKISEEGLNNSGAKLLPEGTVFLSRTASVGFAGIMSKEMATSQDFANWVCGDDLLPEYLVYVFRAMNQEFERLMKGSTHQTIYMPEIRSLEMPLPPTTEQREIANHLRKRVSDIETAKEKSSNLVRELEHKKKAEVTNLIVNGIGKSEFKSIDGSKWYDKIPEGWELLQINRLRKDRSPIVYGIVQPGPDQDEGVPYIKGGQCEPAYLHPDELSKTTNEIAEKYNRARLEEGDLVYEIRGSVGRVVIVPDVLEGANLTQDTARIAPAEDVDNRWLLYALRSEPFRQQMDVETRGATIEGVNLFDLRRGIVPVPSLPEQREIGKRLEKIDADISDAKNVIGKRIKLLEEKRQALITAMVTGQIDITENQNFQAQTTL